MTSMNMRHRTSKRQKTDSIKF